MFSKKQRFSFKTKLPKNTLSFPSFSVRYEKNGEGLKVAVVVSKKVDRRAVVRNKVKRKILEQVRKSINISEQVTLVFYAKQASVSSNLEQEIEEALSKINYV